MSKVHSVEFKAENKQLKESNTRSLSENPVKIKGAKQFICFGCKKYYSGTSGSKELENHFKNIDCREAHFEYIKSLSTAPVVKATVSNVDNELVEKLRAENEKLQKQNEKLKKEISMYEDSMEESEKDSKKMNDILEKIFGKGVYLDEMENRVILLKEKGVLPFNSEH